MHTSAFAFHRPTLQVQMYKHNATPESSAEKPVVCPSRVKHPWNLSLLSISLSDALPWTLWGHWKGVVRGTSTSWWSVIMRQDILRPCHSELSLHLPCSSMLSPSYSLSLHTRWDPHRTGDQLYLKADGATKPADEHHFCQNNSLPGTNRWAHGEIQSNFKEHATKVADSRWDWDK